MLVLGLEQNVACGQVIAQVLSFKAANAQYLFTCRQCPANLHSQVKNWWISVVFGKQNSEPPHTVSRLGLRNPVSSCITPLFQVHFLTTRQTASIPLS